MELTCDRDHPKDDVCILYQFYHGFGLLSCLNIELLGKMLLLLCPLIFFLRYFHCSGLADKSLIYSTPLPCINSPAIYKPADRRLISEMNYPAPINISDKSLLFAVWSWRRERLNIRTHPALTTEGLFPRRWSSFPETADGDLVNSISYNSQEFLWRKLTCWP